MNGVTVTHGADSDVYEKIVGINASAGIAAARQIVGAPSDTTARINGSSTFDGNQLLKTGDEISFYKASGTKGY